VFILRKRAERLPFTVTGRDADEARQKALQEYATLNEHAASAERAAGGVGGPVARRYVTLAQHPTDMVRLACTKCDRRGQYRKSTLIERYGPDKNMVDLRLELAAGCPKIAANKIMDLCGVYYPDRIGR
jgi:hypothetical protein